jgi:hypothetical protein
MLADKFAEMAISGRAPGSSPVSLMVYVDDVDTVFTNAQPPAPW